MQARELEPGSSPAASARPSASASGGVRPQRPMPVSTLTCTLPRNPPSSSCSRASGVEMQTSRPSASAARPGSSGPSRRIGTQARALREAPGPRRASRRRAGSLRRERRPCAALGPVPVAVGLDDGPELRAPEQARKPSRVCGDRRLVDLDVQPGHRASSRPRGRSRSEAENVPCCAAAPRRRGAVRGRSRARAPPLARGRAASRAPTTPESTSPAPAVASPGTAVSTTRSGSSGAR